MSGAEGDDGDEFAGEQRSGAGGEEGEGFGSGEAEQVVFAAVWAGRSGEAGGGVDGEGDGDGPESVVGGAMGGAGPEGEGGGRRDGRAAVEAVDQRGDQERHGGEDADGAGGHVEDVVDGAAGIAAEDAVSEAFAGVEGDTRKKRLDAGFFEAAGDGAGGFAEEDDDGCGEGALECGGEVAFGDRAEVVGGGASEEGGGDGGEAGGVTFAVHDGGLGGSNQMVADGKGGDPDASVADGMDGALGGEEADHGEAELGAGFGDGGACVQEVASGDDAEAWGRRAEDFDDAGGSDAGVGAGVLGADDGIRAQGHGVAGGDMGGFAGLDDGFTGTSVAPASHDEEVRAEGGVDGSGRVAVDGRAVEGGHIDVGVEGFGEDEAERLGEGDLDGLA